MGLTSSGYYSLNRMHENLGGGIIATVIYVPLYIAMTISFLIGIATTVVLLGGITIAILSCPFFAVQYALDGNFPAAGFLMGIFLFFFGLPLLYVVGFLIGCVIEIVKWVGRKLW